MNRECRLPKASLRLWQARMGLVALVPIAVFLFCCRFHRGFRWAVFLSLLFFVLLIFCYLPRYFGQFRWSVTDGRLTVRRGVLIRRTDALPKCGCYYMLSLASPVARRLGLCAVGLKLARGWILLPELPQADMQYLMGEMQDENR